MTDKKYVYENTEVILTGRKATKDLRNNKTDQLVEIQTADKLAPSFKQWVREKDLYEIEEDI